MNRIRDIGTAIGMFARRYHAVIFFIITATGLVFAILTLNAVVFKATNVSSSYEDRSQPSFDQETITKIKELKSSNEMISPLDFSRGRISPFME